MSKGILLLLLLELTSIQGLLQKVKNFQLSAVSPHCVSLSWDPVDSSSRYEYNCKVNDWTNVPDDTEVCGFTPNTPVSCKIRVRGHGETESHFASAHTPSKPSLLLQVTRSKIKRDSGRRRWMYDARWEVNYNLPPTEKYRLEVDGEVVLNNTRRTKQTIYADGDVDLNVTVWVIYENGKLSDPVTKVIRTSLGLPPQPAPGNFTITADTVDPGCVHLKWDPVKYPNGPEGDIIYQYKCRSDSYSNVPANRKVCRFLPNKRATCHLKARRKGNSTPSHQSIIAHAETNTACPQITSYRESLDISTPTIVNRQNRNMWRYKASWRKPLRTYECIRQYKIEIDGLMTREDSWPAEIFIRDGGVNVTLKAWLVYRNGRESLPVYKNFPTPTTDLPPPTAPRSFQLTAANSSCVHISWERVEFPNGLESSISYKVRCKDRVWISVPPSKEICGFQPNELATCQMIASRDSNRASRRHSEIVEASVRTLSEVAGKQV